MKEDKIIVAFCLALLLASFGALFIGDALIAATPQTQVIPQQVHVCDSHAGVREYTSEAGKFDFYHPGSAVCRDGTAWVWGRYE